MEIFDVYPLFDIELVKAEGCYVWDNTGTKYMDLYGGHAVISIGHSHPHYIQAIKNQVEKIGFYSNSIQNPLQQEFADKLGELSGYQDYRLFLCNSGAEANENALKLASFATGKKKIISFSKGFHGRTSLVVAATDNAGIVAPVNQTENTVILPFNDEYALREIFDSGVAAVIIEGIQGVGGVHTPTQGFLNTINELCTQHGALIVIDEVQSGYGRSGKFFAHQYFDIRPDIISMAKGMGNGFPIGGVLIHPKLNAKHGMLGTTFGGNHLACAAGIGVLDVIKDEQLISNAKKVGAYFREKLNGLERVKEVRGLGLMIGISLDKPVAEIRKSLLFDHHIFTGSSSEKETLRILPPLSLKTSDVDVFVKALKEVLLTTDFK